MLGHLLQRRVGGAIREQVADQRRQPRGGVGLLRGAIMLDGQLMLAVVVDEHGRDQLRIEPPARAAAEPMPADDQVGIGIAPVEHVGCGVPERAPAA